MSYLPAWGVGLALAAVPVAHWLLVRRMVAVSGRFTALVDKLRAPAEPDEPALSEAELLAAIAAATEAQFGAAALQPPAPSEARADEAPPAPAPQSASTHVLFLLALAAGGLLSALTRGDARPSATLRGAAFTARFAPVPAALAALFVGGLLVGAGTRMSGGCTSGHALCGSSTLQPGSLAATATFFATGIAGAFAMRALW